MKDSVDDMIEAKEKMHELVEKYGSIEDIPLAEKEKIIKKARKSLDVINGIHIVDLIEETAKMKRDIILLEIAVMGLGLAFLLRFIIK